MQASLGASKESPVLLVADQPLAAQGGGAVILKSLLGDLLGKGVCWASPAQKEDDPARGAYALRQGSQGRTGKHSLVSDVLWYRRALTDEVLERARALNASALWFVLHGVSVHLAAGAVKAGQLPVHLSVHDDPLHATTLRSRRLFFTAPLVARDVARALRGATSVDVICPQMARRYEQKLQVKSMILHRGLREQVAETPRYDLARDGLSIGILGNTYAYAQLPVLARALLEAGRKSGCTPRIICWGLGYERFQREFGGQLAIEIRGHVDEPAAIEQLHSCFLLYLNYPFSWTAKVFRETSFPTKLSTFLYAARPLLIHSPPGSSICELADFGKPYAHVWPSMESSAGAALIAEAAADPHAAESQHLAAEAVRLRYFDYDIHRTTLETILRDLTQKG